MGYISALSSPLKTLGLSLHPCQTSDSILEDSTFSIYLFICLVVRDFTCLKIRFRDMKWMSEGIGGDAVKCRDGGIICVYNACKTVI